MRGKDPDQEVYGPDGRGARSTLMATLRSRRCCSESRFRSTDVDARKKFVVKLADAVNASGGHVHIYIFFHAHIRATVRAIYRGGSHFAVRDKFSANSKIRIFSASKKITVFILCIIYSINISKNRLNLLQIELSFANTRAQ